MVEKQVAVQIEPAPAFPRGKVEHVAKGRFVEDVVVMAIPGFSPCARCLFDARIVR